MHELWSYTRVVRGVTGYDYDANNCGIDSDDTAIDIIESVRGLISSASTVIRKYVIEPVAEKEAVTIGAVKAEVCVDGNGNPYLDVRLVSGYGKGRHFRLYADVVVYYKKSTDDLPAVYMTTMLRGMRILKENADEVNKAVENFYLRHSNQKVSSICSLWTYDEILNGIREYGYSTHDCGISVDSEAIAAINSAKSIVKDAVAVLSKYAIKSAKEAIMIDGVRVEICVDDREQPYLGIYLAPDYEFEDYRLYAEGVQYINRGYGYYPLDRDSMSNILLGMRILKENSVAVVTAVGEVYLNQGIDPKGTTFVNNVYKGFEHDFKVIQKPFDEVVKGLRKRGVSDTSIVDVLLQSLRGVTWEDE